VRRLALRSDRFGIEPELTAKVAHLGCRVYEVPVSYHGRTYAEGKKIRWTDGVQAVGAILAYGLARGQVSHHHGLSTLRAVDGLHRYNAWLWEQINPYVGNRIFEAGCGTGTITRYLASRPAVTAVDVDRDYVALLQTRYADRPHVRVVWADLASAEWPGLDQPVDTVVCMNVLEHLEDDRAVLGRFHDLLAPGGRLILLVPAHQWLYGSIDAAIGHYRRYELQPLCALLRQTGFAIERGRYLNPTGTLGWLLNGRVFPKQTVPSLQARLYDLAFPLLRGLQRLPLRFGLSVLVIARKPVAVDSLRSVTQAASPEPAASMS
jgi:SAM-dependent methyltransferase